MSRRLLLTEEERHLLFDIPVDPASLAKYYSIEWEDRGAIDAKRSDINRLGFALHLGLLRHPGFGLRHGELVPDQLVAYIAGQLGINAELLAGYPRRDKTRLEHGWEAANRLGLRSFEAADLAHTLELATAAAATNDRGFEIACAIMEGLRKARLILPAPARIERIGIAGRARARRYAADAVVERLTDDQIAALDALVIVSPQFGMTPLAWLRDLADSPSPKNLSGLLERLAYVRRIGIGGDIAARIEPQRFSQLIKEGAIAPAFLLTDYSERRRRATLAATIVDMQARLADAAITMFGKQTASLFAKARNAQKRNYEATSKDVGRLMRLFGSTIAALYVAREEGSDPWDAIDGSVGWHRLLIAAPEVQAIADLAQEDPLMRASDKYMTLRRYAPAFLEAFDFKATASRDPVLSAVTTLRRLNAEGKRDVPADAPLPFRKAWKAAIVRNGEIDRRLYETATVALLRERLESGDIWVDGSKDHLRFDSYLVSQDQLPDLLETLPFDTDANSYLQGRAAQLDWRLRGFASKLRRNKLEGVELENGQLKVAPIQANAPAAVERLDAMIDRMLPKIRITELLAEVAERTDFVSAFAELRSGKSHPNPEALLAAILADATNLGVERMANASQGVTYAQIAWTHGWYLSEENYAAALARIVDAQSALPLSPVWGDGTTSSSDGQFFRSGRRGSAGSVNARYGNEPGQKIYTHVVDQYTPFHSRLISATAGEAPYVLDGLVAHGSDLEISTHYTDTGGSSDHVFALAHLLGFRFVPRLRDLADRRIGCFEHSSKYAAIAPLIGRPINTDVIKTCWDDILRVAASIKDRKVLPSFILKKLGAHRRQNRLDFALQEVGRIERALFTIDWLESKQLRKQCHAGLNKGEARHSLAQAIFAHKQGRMRDRTFDNQALKASGLNLVTAAIVYWNTLYLGRAVDTLRANGIEAPDELLAHTSPLGWRHISLTGDYMWQDLTNGLGTEGFRELNQPNDLGKLVA